MFDLTILLLTTVLILLLIITIYQRLLWVTYFLLLTYFTYLLFLFFLVPKEKERLYMDERDNSEISDIKIVDDLVKHSVDKTENKTEMSNRLDSLDNNIYEDTLISRDTTLLELNYIQICKNIDSKDRTAINPGLSFRDTVRNLYCISGIDNRNGGKQEIVHQWTYKGMVVARVNMLIDRSINWRCWSIVNIDPRKIGAWSVSVMDTNEIVFGTTNFYVKRTE